MPVFRGGKQTGALEPIRRRSPSKAAPRRPGRRARASSPPGGGGDEHGRRPRATNTGPAAPAIAAWRKRRCGAALEIGGRAAASVALGSGGPSSRPRGRGAGETGSLEASSTIGAAAWLDEASPPAPTLKRTEARTFWQSVSCCHIGEALLARHVRSHGLEVDVARVGVPRALAARGPRGDALVALVVVVVVVVVQVVVVLVVVRERALGRVGEHREVVAVAVVAAAAAGRQVVAAGSGALVEHADGAVLADAVGHLSRVDPERELVGQQLAQTSFVQAAGAARLGQDRVHLVVDANAAVARALGRHLGKPVVLVVVPQQVL